MEGICAGISSGGAISAALRLSAELENATIVAIVCDRGDRYLSTGVYTQKDTPLPTDTQVQLTLKPRNPETLENRRLRPTNNQIRDGGKTSIDRNVR